MVLLAVAVSITANALYQQRCSCVTGPPDYLCPTAQLLQVYIPHEVYCTRYYKCTDGRAIEFQCPYGRYFDPLTNSCSCNFTLCYRPDPCIQFVDSCRCCLQQFVNTGLEPQNFYICYNDGYAVAQTCPVAVDPCTNTTEQLVFVNGKCEVAPPTCEHSGFDAGYATCQENVTVTVDFRLPKTRMPAETERRHDNETKNDTAAAAGLRHS
uniref:Chitin-binding type-2 domain-containing protein n=1 Tax=Anopheles farauti TaxID=69004 RepID=A0A182PZY5_9DIPT